MAAACSGGSGDAGGRPEGGAPRVESVPRADSAAAAQAAAQDSAQGAAPGTTPGTTPGSTPGSTPGADEGAASEAASPTPTEVVRRYYEAINARDYGRAYALWGDGGRASGQTLEVFEAGYAQTDSVEVRIGQPGRVEGAAGSRYVDVPVEIWAKTRTGRVQRFAGTYTLRRAVVTGASAADRRWHLASADIHRSGG